ncbi:MAG: hypothetical protein QM489_01195 [Candidatus Izemoplasma sp.]
MSFNLPTDPAQLKKVAGCIQEMVDCQVRIQGEKDLMKDIRDRMKSEFEIPTEETNKLFRAAYDGNAKFDEKCAKQTELECAVENLKAVAGNKVFNR